jgi:hypothetical protein
LSRAEEVTMNEHYRIIKRHFGPFVWYELQYHWKVYRKTYPHSIYIPHEIFIGRRWGTILRARTLKEAEALYEQRQAPIPSRRKAPKPRFCVVRGEGAITETGG